MAKPYPVQIDHIQEATGLPRELLEACPFTNYQGPVYGLWDKCYALGIGKSKPGPKARKGAIAGIMSVVIEFLKKDDETTPADLDEVWSQATEECVDICCDHWNRFVRPKTIWNGTHLSDIINELPDSAENFPKYRDMLREEELDDAEFYQEATESNLEDAKGRLEKLKEKLEEAEEEVESAEISNDVEAEEFEETKKKLEEEIKKLEEIEQPVNENELKSQIPDGFKLGSIDEFLTWVYETYSTKVEKTTKTGSYFSVEARGSGITITPESTNTERRMPESELKRYYTITKNLESSVAYAEPDWNTILSLGPYEPPDGGQNASYYAIILRDYVLEKLYTEKLVQKGYQPNQESSVTQIEPKVRKVGDKLEINGEFVTAKTLLIIVIRFLKDGEWHTKGELDAWLRDEHFHITEEEERNVMYESSGHSVLYHKTANAISILRRIEWIEDWNENPESNLQMGKWRLTEWAMKNVKYWNDNKIIHALNELQVSVDDDPPVAPAPQGGKGGDEESHNYLMLKHNSNSESNPYLDQLGRTYHYKKGLPNSSLVEKGTRTIWFENVDGRIHVWGFGIVSKVEKDAESAQAFFEDFQIFDLGGGHSALRNPIPENPQYVLLEHLENNIKQFYPWNIRNSIIKIDQEMYESIIAGGDALRVQEFDDDPIPKLTKEEIDTGIKKIQEKLWIDPTTINEIVINLLAGKPILLVGPVGTGKTELARMIPEILWKNHGGYFSEVYTATADWTTHDVIGGIVPMMRGDNVGYKIENGCVTHAIKENWSALKQSRRNYSYKKSYVDESEKAFRGVWLVIDEFNRADIDKAFGQIFTSIETKILKISTNQKQDVALLKIPNDFRMIGTLNSADKHTLFKLSDALKRRFAIIKVDVPPNNERDEDGYFIEINYAVDNALREIEHITSRDKSSLAKAHGMQELPYEILTFVRFTKPLGTAVLKSIYQTWLVGTSLGYSDLNTTLDIALTDNLSPQLESLGKETLEVLREIVAKNGNPVQVLRDKEKDKILRAEYAESFEIFLNFVNIAAIPRMGTNQEGIRGEPLPDAADLFSEAEIKNKTEEFRQGNCFENNDFVRKLTEGYNKSYWHQFGFPKFADSIDDIRKNLI